MKVNKSTIFDIYYIYKIILQNDIWIKILTFLSFVDDVLPYSDKGFLTYLFLKFLVDNGEGSQSGISLGSSKLTSVSFGFDLFL